MIFCVCVCAPVHFMNILFQIQPGFQAPGQAAQQQQYTVITGDAIATLASRTHSLRSFWDTLTAALGVGGARTTHDRSVLGRKRLHSATSTTAASRNKDESLNSDYLSGMRITWRLHPSAVRLTRWRRHKLDRLPPSASCSKILADGYIGMTVLGDVFKFALIWGKQSIKRKVEWRWMFWMWWSTR